MLGLVATLADQRRRRRATPPLVGRPSWFRASAVDRPRCCRCAGGCDGVAPGVPLADARALAPAFRGARGHADGDRPRSGGFAAGATVRPVDRACGRWRLARRHRLAHRPRRARRSPRRGARAARAAGFRAAPAVADTPGAASAPGTTSARAADIALPPNSSAWRSLRCQMAALRLGRRSEALTQLGLRQVGDSLCHAAPVAGAALSTTPRCPPGPALGAQPDRPRRVLPRQLRSARRTWPEPITAAKDIRTRTPDRLLDPLYRNLATEAIGARRLRLTLPAPTSTAALRIGRARADHGAPSSCTSDERLPELETVSMPLAASVSTT